MNLNLTANAAVVSSASRGIGLATVQTLIDEGVRAVDAARITVVLEAATREWLLVVLPRESRQKDRSVSTRCVSSCRR